MKNTVAALCALLTVCSLAEAANIAPVVSILHDKQQTIYL